MKQDKIYHLQTNANNFEGELAYEVVDDGISPAIDLSFNFTFYGSTFTQARMATNGCLILVIVVAIAMTILLTLLTDSTLIPYTLSFWTDLIRDSNSRMKSWGDSRQDDFWLV